MKLVFGNVVTLSSCLIPEKLRNQLQDIYKASFLFSMIKSIVIQVGVISLWVSVI